MTRHVAAALAVAALACGGRVPETRYYHLAMPAAGGSGGTAVLVLADLATDPGYDDERMVYRVNPYRFDYYDYHRWSALPGIMVGTYLERALEKTGRFRAVVREASSDAAVVLSGRVAAVEEVDVSRTRWLGHLVLELRLADAATGEVLWSQQFDESVAMAHQTPEGLARAVSAAMARIVEQIVPAVGQLAEDRSRLRAATPATAQRDH